MQSVMAGLCCVVARSNRTIGTTLNKAPLVHHRHDGVNIIGQAAKVQHASCVDSVYARLQPNHTQQFCTDVWTLMGCSGAQNSLCQQLLCVALSKKAQPADVNPTQAELCGHNQLHPTPMLVEQQCFLHVSAFWFAAYVQR
jgi:hypothetical protein